MGIEKDKFKYETEHLNISHISPDNGIKQTIGNQPWWFKMQLAGIVIGMLIIVIGFVGLLAIPFEPYKFYGWHGIPDVVCPGEQIHTSTVSKVEAGPYTLDSIAGYASVVNGNDKAVDTWVVDNTDIEPHPKELTPSSIIRTAPAASGYYRLGIDATIHGHMFGIVPRYQEIKAFSKEDFFVLGESDKQCKGNL